MGGGKSELLKPKDILCGNNLFTDYDKLYGACVFDWNRSVADRLVAMGVEVGGTGSGNKNVLLNEVEHIMPDYSLYGIENCSYGYLTRGCPRRCPFCIVADKEGTVARKVANLDEFWNGQKEIQI